MTSTGWITLALLAAALLLWIASELHRPMHDPEDDTHVHYRGEPTTKCGRDPVGMQCTNDREATCPVCAAELGDDCSYGGGA